MFVQKLYTSWNSVSLELLLSFSLLLIFKIIFYIKFPSYHCHETNTHLMFQRNWKAAMACLQNKRPVLHCTIVFSVSCFNCTNFTSIYLDFLIYNIKNFVKLLNNPGMAFVAIWHKVSSLVAHTVSRNAIRI